MDGARAELFGGDDGGSVEMPQAVERTYELLESRKGCAVDVMPAWIKSRLFAPKLCVVFFAPEKEEERGVVLRRQIRNDCG